MNSVAAKENLLKQVIGFTCSVVSTRFFYQAVNSFAERKIPNRLIMYSFLMTGWGKRVCGLAWDHYILIFKEGIFLKRYISVERFLGGNW